MYYVIICGYAVIGKHYIVTEKLMNILRKKNELCDILSYARNINIFIYVIDTA